MSHIAIYSTRAARAYNNFWKKPTEMEKLIQLEDSNDVTDVYIAWTDIEANIGQNRAVYKASSLRNCRGGFCV